MLTQNLCDQARKRASGVGLILFIFLLTACGTQPAPPAAPTSIATPTSAPTSPPTSPPTETPTPPPTPTPEPTSTPTPIPTLPPEQVGGLEGVPDPRAAAPELLDLRKSDAPIPQFVNAMKMAGIEIEPEEVANSLQYQTITGADGKQYVIATFNLDPNPNKKGETLEGPIPLVIWGEEKGWRSIVNSLRELADARNFRFGSQIVYYKLNDPTYVDLAKGNFNFLVSVGELGEPDLWRISDINQNFNYDYSRADKILRLARDMKAPILLLHIANPTEWPDWARKLPQNEFEEIGKNKLFT